MLTLRPGPVTRSIAGGLLALVLVACSDDSPRADETPNDPTVSVPADVGVDPNGTEPVSLRQAEQAALAEIGDGRVTWSGPEDDRGAAWEVEITRPDGSEVDVLVAADGSIVKVVEKFGEGPPLDGPGDVPSSGVVSQQEAEQAALAEIGDGRVTWVGREDERGAAWEVEITRPDGSEIDVLVAPDGSIIP